MKEVDVAIVGGGMTGILAARKLMNTGFKVLVLDKSKSVGGRLATRRINDGRADHGAQFFTVRTDSFQQMVDEWEENRWVSRWFGEKHPRYKAANGMNQLVKNLANEIPLQLVSKVERIERNEEKYVAFSEGGEQVKASAILFTPPAPQTLELLENSEVLLSEEAAKALKEITFDPALVCLLTMKGETAGLSLEGHKDSDLPDGIERIVDNQIKGISDEKIISIYATAAFSKVYYNQEDESILDQMLAKLGHFLPREAISSWQLKRWRYAQANHVHHHPFLQVSIKEPVYVAGDAFLHEEDQAGKTRIESAVISGLSAAEELQRFLNERAST
ncbi:NAD(P)/FAD-dependent oxidoreductase [Pseudalkalibacillus hwajinpoensis]|uniref:NAD(P)/FAD-dependent oxidoreductase n=1 Tax=Guptibacillus hwajinpoensis TaxID=208199 RepID=UPI001CFE6FFB|nr:FAD-dependent oxidoreductase [Pseudalkalibacillus hwajinpoensis]